MHRVSKDDQRVKNVGVSGKERREPQGNIVRSCSWIYRARRLGSLLPSEVDQVIGVNEGSSSDTCEGNGRREI